MDVSPRAEGSMLIIRVFVAYFGSTVIEYGYSLSGGNTKYFQRLESVVGAVVSEFRKQNFQNVAVSFQPEAEICFFGASFVRHLPLNDDSQRELWKEFEKYFDDSPLRLYSTELIVVSPTSIEKRALRPGELPHRDTSPMGGPGLGDA